MGRGYGGPSKEGFMAGNIVVIWPSAANAVTYTSNRDEGLRTCSFIIVQTWQ